MSFSRNEREDDYEYDMSDTQSYDESGMGRDDDYEPEQSSSSFGSGIKSSLLNVALGKSGEGYGKLSGMYEGSGQFSSIGGGMGSSRRSETILGSGKMGGSGGTKHKYTSILGASRTPGGGPFSKVKSYKRQSKSILGTGYGGSSFHSKVVRERSSNILGGSSGGGGFGSTKQYRKRSGNILGGSMPNLGGNFGDTSAGSFNTILGSGASLDDASGKLGGKKPKFTGRQNAKARKRRKRGVMGNVASSRHGISRMGL